MTICHGSPWCRNVADDHCPFSIRGWWLFFYPLSYLTLTMEELKKVEEERRKGGVAGQKDTPGQEETAGQRAAARQAGTASKEMCTFLIINISSLQLIPMNMIVYRSQYGCFLASNFPYFQRVYSL